MFEDSMKVGELARRTGLTVRTLHHYDEIGLLPPARRTPAGHRLYGTEEVRRLQQIASLRHLGFSLEEVRGCLARPDHTLERTLAMHVQRLREEAGRQQRLITLLESLRERVAAAEEVSIQDVAATIEETVRFERYYTVEQREALALRAEALGEERISRVQREWAGLFEDFGEAMRLGLDAGDPRVQELAGRAEELIGQFTGGDAGIRDSMARMFREEGGENVLAGRMALPAGLWDFYGRAMAVRGGGEASRRRAADPPVRRPR